MKKILVPIDGSCASKKAAENAIEMASKNNADLVFVFVATISDLHNDSWSYGDHLDKSLNTYKEVVEEVGQKFIDKFVDNLRIEDIAVNKLVVQGNPYEEIIKVAENDHIDLIVMGRRGFSKVKRFLIGSVTQRVIANSPCPVLVVVE